MTTSSIQRFRFFFFFLLSKPNTPKFLAIYQITNSHSSAQIEKPFKKISRDFTQRKYVINQVVNLKWKKFHFLNKKNRYTVRSSTNKNFSPPPTFKPKIPNCVYLSMAGVSSGNYFSNNFFRKLRKQKGLAAIRKESLGIGIIDLNLMKRKKAGFTGRAEKEKELE